MLPRKLHSQPRNIGKFEVINADGRIYQFPQPSLLQRLARLSRARPACRELGRPKEWR